jgi:aryl-alcohol dehydrogenase-like predicted oxidoreductase
MNNVTTIGGAPTSSLGLAAYPDQSPDCVQRAFEQGINFFFFYSPGQTHFIQELKLLVQQRRDRVIVASGSGSRTPAGLRAVRRKILSAVNADTIDIFFAEYIHPGDDNTTIFGPGGVLDELQQWKSKGWIRLAGASSHDRKLAKELANDPRVDVLMHRFNMAHRKAGTEVFPTAIKTQTPVVAFTATRWGTLLKPHAKWADPPPTAADCYRYCLAQPAVQIVLTAPKSAIELDENLHVLKLPPMDHKSQAQWERFGDLVYSEGGGQSHVYESQWP